MRYKNIEKAIQDFHDQNTEDFQKITECPYENKYIRESFKAIQKLNEAIYDVAHYSMLADLDIEKFNEDREPMEESEYLDEMIKEYALLFKETGEEFCRLFNEQRLDHEITVQLCMFTGTLVSLNAVRKQMKINSGEMTKEEVERMAAYRKLSRFVKFITDMNMGDEQ